MQWQINMCSTVAARWELVSLAEAFTPARPTASFLQRAAIYSDCLHVTFHTGACLNPDTSQNRCEYLNRIACEIFHDKSLQTSPILNIWYLSLATLGGASGGTAWVIKDVQRSDKIKKAEFLFDHHRCAAVLFAPFYPVIYMCNWSEACRQHLECHFNLIRHPWISAAFHQFSQIGNPIVVGPSWVLITLKILLFFREAFHTGTWYTLNPFNFPSDKRLPRRDIMF